MASTRNINTRGNYYLENKRYMESNNHILYKNSQNGEAYHNNLAGNGLINSKLPRESLSKNPIEIESFLFGINSTNLVDEQPVLHAELKQLTPVNIYEKSPVIIPLPLVVDRNRPYPI
jgi:hypothetical protein